MSVSSLSSWMHNVSHQRSYSESERALTVLFDSLIDWNLVCEGATWDGDLTSQADKPAQHVWCGARVAGRPVCLRDVAWPISQGRAIAISAGRATTCWAVRTSPHNTTQRRALQSLYSRLRLAAVCGLLCCEWTPPPPLSHPALRTASSLTSGAAARSRAHRRPDNNSADSVQGRNSLEPLQINCLLVFFHKNMYHTVVLILYFYTNPLTVQPTSALK